ncbi:MAG: hypothetical protein M5U28_23225 [Sandaracinaceae bacterium]|nr:hypothetical protein [Sandaracinaceae bacterium]
MSDEIDYQEYVKATRFPHPIGIVLIIQLLRAALRRPNASVRRALDRMREAALNAQGLAVEKLRTSPEALRPIDLRLDNGIMALREVLDGKARLAGTEIAGARGEAARQVYPGGTGFVMLSLPEEWATVKAHLDRIDQDELARAIDDIAGPEHLPYIRAAHAELGEKLGLGGVALTATETTQLRDSSVRMAKAIAAYGRAMVATVDEDDAESVAAFKRAMYPLDAYRAAAFARSAKGEEPVLDTDVSPTDPVPPVPSDPLV